MKTYFALFLIATLSALIITPLIRRFCERFKLLDVPADGRRVHTSAIPRLGGVAIYLSLMLALSSLFLVSNLVTEALGYYAMGGRIEALAVPFVGAVHFPPVISFVLTVFWLVAISNAFNLIDGMDGLATGAALFSSVVILVVA